MSDTAPYVEDTVMNKKDIVPVPMELHSSEKYWKTAHKVPIISAMVLSLQSGYFQLLFKGYTQVLPSPVI